MGLGKTGKMPAVLRAYLEKNKKSKPSIGVWPSSLCLNWENEMLNIFLTTGFLFDTANERLILVDDDKIYNFLQNDIEKYMQKFEVLATDNFKKREIREPKIGSLGVRIENNLLNIDFSNIDFSFDELSEIMEKYRLRKNIID